MKKTDRKNKTNLTVKWPKNIFTIKELNAANPEFVEITLRVRLKKAIESGEVNEMGVLHNGKGRPTIVFVHGNPSSNHIEEAKSREVLLKEGLTVNVIKIDVNNQASENTIVTVDVDTEKTETV
jgi:hypothetical protein